MSIKVKADVIKIIAAVVRDYDCSLSDILPLYKSVSKLYQVYSERNIRTEVSKVFLSLAERFEEFAKVAPIVDDLNAYSKKRIQEPDFERRLSAFSLVNRQEYPNLTLVEWMPIIYSALYFINDENDQSMRSSASYTLIRYVDCLNSKHTEQSAAEYVEFLKLVVLDNVRLGLRKKNELVQNEYISVFSHIVESAKYFHDLDDLKVLLYNGNEEADFFKNVNHPQVHRRQRAIKRLSEHGSELSGASISRYLLPMIEHYAFWTEEKLRNVAHETVNTISILMVHCTWNQYKAIFIRYIQIMNSAKAKGRDEQLRDAVLLVVALSTSLHQWASSAAEKPKDFPKQAEKLDEFVFNFIDYVLY
ncbi:unnamed protein product [Ambrosiozyma monospora]|uniref:Unnamed protein product n=1 Tax=Ambrosiozyma monospora TaxID=43982 RepID=A0ACB5TWB1_AMBMO|nr:unnamed protein product [Ambrosiozyma monospora]